jgi:lactate dehydrogenase-like 2-hydroxyacid dehydrogenase
MRSCRYEIRIRGRLGEKVAKRFEGFDMEVEPVETVLRGPVQDQAALHGVLERIESLGLELLEVRRVEDAGPEH